jgi:hypothetical protein
MPMRFGIVIWLPSDTFKVIADWTERLVPAGGSIDDLANGARNR